MRIPDVVNNVAAPGNNLSAALGWQMTAETSAQRAVTRLALWGMPVLLALIPIVIAISSFWSNYNHGKTWNLTTAKTVWSGELCTVERKQGKNWRQHVEGVFECAEAENFVKQNNSLTQQLRTNKDDYVRFTYTAGGVEQDVQHRLYSVSRVPLAIGQEFVVMVDPANPMSVDKTFDSAEETKTMAIWIAVGVLLAIVIHFFMRWVLRANERKLAKQKEKAEAAAKTAAAEVAAAGGSAEEQAAAAAKAAAGPAAQALAGPPSAGSKAAKWIGIAIFALAGLAGAFLALGGIMNKDWGVVTFAVALVGFGAGIYRFLRRFG